MAKMYSVQCTGQCTMQCTGHYSLRFNCGVQYSAHNSVQCTVYFSVQYSKGMWDVQALIGL